MNFMRKKKGPKKRKKPYELHWDQHNRDGCTGFCSSSSSLSPRKHNRQPRPQNY